MPRVQRLDAVQNMYTFEPMKNRRRTEAEREARQTTRGKEKIQRYSKPPRIGLDFDKWADQ